MARPSLPVILSFLLTCFGYSLCPSFPRATPLKLHAAVHATPLLELDCNFLLFGYLDAQGRACLVDNPTLFPYYCLNITITETGTRAIANSKDRSYGCCLQFPVSRPG